MKSGVHAGLSSRRSRVQVPSGPLAHEPPQGGRDALGRVAQLAEHAPEKRGVTGSTPVSTTPLPDPVRRGGAGYPRRGEGGQGLGPLGRPPRPPRRGRRRAPRHVRRPGVAPHRRPSRTRRRLTRVPSTAKSDRAEPVHRAEWCRLGAPAGRRRPCRQPLEARVAAEGAAARVPCALQQEPSPDTSQPPSSSGLGHHPFKVAARVRIPLGVRARPRSRGAVWSARRPVKPEAAGSNPVGTATAALEPRSPTVG